MCQVSHVTCHLSHGLTPIATATEPPYAILPQYAQQDGLQRPLKQYVLHGNFRRFLSKNCKYGNHILFYNFYVVNLFVIDNLT